jgi:NAD(P)-dependent dehydrogenase (short-subunit alcohol dehydrogenase family)
MAPTDTQSTTSPATTTGSDPVPDASTQPNPTTRPLAVVTGASSGLGRELASELARRGWNLVIDARRPEPLEEVATELGAVTQVIALQGDVSDAVHRREIAAAAARLGPVALIVNNASTLGASPLPQLLDLPADVLAQTFDVNVVAPLAIIQELRPVLADRLVVVDVTSDAGAEPYETWGGYGSSKAALEHLSRVLAVEQPDWRVLVVDPGDMRTPMHQDAFPGEDISDRPPPSESVPGIIALIEGDQPSGRYVARQVTEVGR